MNNEQSSVEWLFGQIPGACKSSKGAFDALEKAKAMHKGEMEDVWEGAISNYGARGGNYVIACEDFHDYYEQTYGGNK